MMVESFSSLSCSFCSSVSPSIRGILMSVTTISTSLVRLQHGQGFDAVAGEQKADRAVTDLVAELLQDERLQVRLVVDDQDPCGHAARSTRVSISLRSIDEVDRLGQKRLGAILQRLALGLRIAIGGDHDDRNIGPHGLRLGQQFKPAHPRHVDVGQDQNERHACLHR